MFACLAFVEKLTALVPLPRMHLTRFFGYLASHAKIRSQIIPKTPFIVAPVVEKPMSTGATIKAAAIHKKNAGERFFSCRAAAPSPLRRSPFVGFADSVGTVTQRPIHSDQPFIRRRPRPALVP
jgi:hypothetical protein